MNTHYSKLMLLLVAVQVLCAGFFSIDLLQTIFGLDILSMHWQVREALEIAAGVGLILGAIAGVVAISFAYRLNARSQNALKVARGEFATVVEDKFEEWGLTPAEKDVALFAIKGFNIAEMAELRGSTEGTIKAQCNKIYRKAEVTGRAQLVSVLVEELL